ncbi:MAG: ABC transporter ATP-binding protein [Betaproteobacteria bacterium]|nr:ABC transporter ATP-binding protein [Betaproteobacteria bacterium]
MSESAPRAVVALDGVAKTYPSGTRALDPVTLAVREGEFVTLLGPSGCGKSTILNLIAGLAAPTRGRIAWWGAGPEALGARGRRLAMVFQSATLMPWARVATNVRLPLDLAGVPRPAAEGAVRDSLALVGLAGFESSYPRELSGGMQMRASIARALVTQPDLLLMDEPFGALDEITRTRLDAELLGLWSDRRFTVVFVTHSIYEAVFLSQRVVVMSARPGRLLDEVTIDEPYPRTEAFRVSQRFLEHAQALQSGLVEASRETGVRS